MGNTRGWVAVRVARGPGVWCGVVYCMYHMLCSVWISDMMTICSGSGLVWRLIYFFGWHWMRRANVDDGCPSDAQRVCSYQFGTCQKWRNQSSYHFTWPRACFSLSCQPIVCEYGHADGKVRG